MRMPATQKLTDGELYYTIRNGVRLMGMPAWGDSDTVKLAAVLFIRHLPKLVPEEAKEMEKLNPKNQMDQDEDEPSGAGQEPEHHHHH